MQISWTSKKITHAKSPISGWGVFAKHPIKKGELVAVFGGYCIDIQSLAQISDKQPRVHKTVLDIGYQIDDNIVFAPTSSKQFSDIEYLNHSCDANCGFNGAIHLVALRDIEKNEEITMDYATCITHKIFEMTCGCGSKGCRKHIKSTDWKNGSIQKKYKSHFQPYILEKIKALRLKKQ